MSQRRKFTPEYKREAARLVIESGRTISEVAAELDLHPSLLGKWVRVENERSANPDGQTTAELKAENARLRRELREAQKDIEFLSKATAFFARKQR